ncbi:MAG TPA: Rrf2 family transcriptional regulator [Tepidisphaeraceae bacterium]|jgi:Rrf2 family protein
MFSLTTEYALRVAVFLAGLSDTPATTRQIAAATRIPEGYLAKILQSLGRSGLIKAQRGLHGGSVLGRDPTHITVLDVINAIDPFPRINTCPLELKSHGANLCPLHKRLDDAMALVEESLRKSTIAELVGDGAGSIPLQELGSSPTAAIRAAELAFPAEKPVPLTVSAAQRRKSKSS